MRIGDKIRELRRRHHMVQADFGKKVGVSANHLSRFENHRLKPGRVTLQKLAETCNVPLECLLDDAADLPPVPERFAVEDPELAERFIEAAGLPKEERRAILMVIDAFLAKQRVAQALGQVHGGQARGKGEGRGKTAR